MEKIVNLLGSGKFINQEIQMYYLVTVDHNSMAARFTRSDRGGFLEVLYIQCSGWDCFDMLWNGSEEDGNVRSECEEDEGTD